MFFTCLYYCFFVLLLYFILHAAFDICLWLDWSGMVFMVGTVGLEGLVCMGRTGYGFLAGYITCSVRLGVLCFVIY